MLQFTIILATLSLAQVETLESINKEDLIKPLSQRVDDALNDLLGEEYHHRARRSTGVMASTIKVAQWSVGRERLNMKSSVPLQKLGLENPTDLVIFALNRVEQVHFDNQDVYMAVANGIQGVAIYKFDAVKENFFKIYNIAGIIPIELEFFLAKESEIKYKNLFAVTGEIPGKDKVTVLKIYEVTNSSGLLAFKEIQSLPMDRIGPMKYFSIQSTTYLAVGFEYRKTMQGKVYQSHAQIIVMKYTNNMFAIDYALAGLSVVDLEAFWIGSDLFLAAVNRRDQAGKYAVSSVIYKYNLKTKQFAAFQYIPTFGARDVEQFEMVGTHYLGVANEVEGNIYLNDSATHSDLYRYQHGKFERVLQVTTLGAKKLKSLALITCKSEVLLFYSDARENIDQAGLFALSSYKTSIEVLPFSIYNLDNSTSDGQLTKPHPLAIAPFILGSKTYVVIGSEMKSGSNNLFRLSYEVEEVQSPWLDTRDVINNGLAVVRSQITELFKQIDRIDAILKRAVLADRAQDIFGHKIFSNGLDTNTTYIRVANVTHGNIVFTTSGEDRRANPEYFNDTITVTNLHSSQSLLNQTLYAQEKQLSLVVYKDKTQDVYSKLSFTKTHFPKSVTVNHLHSITGLINGISIPKLNEQTVRRTDNIIITGYKRFLHNQTFWSNISVHGNINGVDLSQSAILTRLDEEIMGKKTFTGYVHIKKNLNVNGLIDKVKVSEDVLMLDRDESVLSSKTFGDDVNVSRVLTYAPINNVNFSAFVGDVMLEDAVTNIDGKKEIVRSVKSFQDVTIDGLTQNLDLSDLNNKTVKLDSNFIPINSLKTFAGQTVIGNNLTVGGKLNELNFPDDVVLREGIQIIMGHKTFFQKIVIKSNLLTSGLVDNINLSRSAVTLSGVQDIAGFKKFTKTIQLKSNLNFSADATVDNVKVAEFGNDVMLLSKPQNVTGWKGFDKEVLMYGNVDVLDKIDDMSMKEYQSLFNTSVLLYGDQAISSGKYFNRNISVTRNLSIDGLLNGYKIPSGFVDVYSDQVILGEMRMLGKAHFESTVSVDRVNNITVSQVFPTVLRIDKPATVAGFKRFQAVFNVRETVTVNGTVNDIDISKEVMTTNTPQTVNAEQRFEIFKTVKNIIIKRNLEVRTTVDHIKVSNLSRNVARINQRQEIATTEIVGNVVVENINIMGQHINNVDIKELSDDAITLNTEQEIKSTKVFTDPAVIKQDLILDSTLDNIDISELDRNSLKVNTDGQINENIKLKSATFRQNLTIQGKIHGVKLSSLLDTLVTKSNNHVLQGKVLFNNDLIFHGNITVNDTFNGMSLEEDVVLVAKSQSIRGAKSFFTNLTVHGNIHCEGNVDTINITKLNESVVSKTRPQEISGIKTFETDVNVGGNIDAEDGSKIDGVDVSSLDADAVKIYGDQKVNGSKVFNSTIAIGKNILLRGLINGYNWTDYIRNIVYVNREQYITGNKTFLSDVTVEQNVTVNGNISVRGKVNNISISNLAADCVDRFSTQEILGQNTFNRSLHIYNKVDVNGSVNFVRISEEAVTKSGNQTIIGRKHFQSGIKLTGNALVKGLVDGQNIQALSEDTLRKKGLRNQTVTGKKSFVASQHFKSDVYVEGLLDNRNFSAITPIALADKQNVTGSLSFTETLKVNGNITVLGNVSEVNLDEFERTRVTTNTKQSIRGNIKMESNFNVRQNIINTGTVNGVDLSELKLGKPKLNQEIWQTRTSLGFSLNNSEHSISRISDQFSASPLEFSYMTVATDLSNYSTNSMISFKMKSQLWLALSVPRNDSSQCVESKLLTLDKFQDRLRASLVQSIPTSGAVRFMYLGQIDNKELIFVANRYDGCGLGGPSQVFTFDEGSRKFTKQQDITSKEIADVETFVSSDGVHHMIIVNSRKNIIDKPSPDVAIWHMVYFRSLYILTQTIKAANAKAAHIFAINNITYMAVAMSSDLETESTESRITIYRFWDNRFVVHQEIPMHGARDVSSFSVNGQMYLVATSNKIEASNGRSSLEGALYVYLYNNNLRKFQWYQMIPMFNPSQLGLFSIKKRTYLTVLTRALKASVYEFHAGIGFHFSFSIHQQGIQSIKGFVVQNELYLSLAVQKENNHSQKACRFSGSVIVKVFPKGIDRCQREQVCQQYKVLS